MTGGASATVGGVEGTGYWGGNSVVEPTGGAGGNIRPGMGFGWITGPVPPVSGGGEYGESPLVAPPI
jgi:hypothetical protein